MIIQPIRILFGAACLSFAAYAVATPQTFRSSALKGTMDEFYRVTVTRDCIDLKASPHVKCTQQVITVADKTGRVNGRFDINEIPLNKDGTHKVNLASIHSIDEDFAGDGTRYFLLRFVPLDSDDLTILPNGQMFPKYYEIITDAELRPLKGMRLSANGAAQTWLDVKRKKFAKKKSEGEDGHLLVAEYVKVMEDR